MVKIKPNLTYNSYDYRASNKPLTYLTNTTSLHLYISSHRQHDYQLYLALNDIEHTKTKAQSPQTNGICERFHKTILQEFYQVTLRKHIYNTIEDLQKDLDK